MAKIAPFQGIRYNPHKVGDLSKVVSQPYDRVRYGLQDQYYDLHPYNIVRITKGREYDSDSPRPQRLHPRPRLLPDLAGCRLPAARHRAGPLRLPPDLYPARWHRADPQGLCRRPGAGRVRRGHRPAPRAHPLRPQGGPPEPAAGHSGPTLGRSLCSTPTPRTGSTPCSTRPSPGARPTSTCASCSKRMCASRCGSSPIRR